MSENRNEVSENRDEEEQLRQVTLQNAQSIFRARQRAEEELARTREELWKQSEWLRVTLASIGDAVVTTDTEGRVLSLNGVAEKLTGWAHQEARGRPLAEVFRIINENTRQPVENPAERALREGRTVGLGNHTILIARDGTETPIDDSAAPICDDQGRAQGVVLIFRSIAERKRADEALGKREHQLRLALEAGRMGTWEWDVATGKVTWSAGLEAIHGLAPGTFQGTFEAFQQDVHPEDRQHVLGSIARTAERGEDHQIEYRIVLPSGEVRWVEGRGKLFRDSSGAPVRMLGVCSDITERKRAEEALRESERRFKSMADTAPAVLWITEPDGACSFLSRGWYEFSGQTEEEALGFGWLAVVHPDDRESTRSVFLEANARREPFALDYRLRRADGYHRWAIGAGRPRFAPGGEYLGFIGSVIDVHERKQAEERERALMERALAATAKFEAVFNQSGIFAGVVDPDGLLREVNDLAVNWCGYTREEVLDRPFWETPWWRGSEEVKERIRAATEQAASGRVFREVLPYWVADGSERVTDFAMHPIRDETGAVRLLHPTGIDITERKQTEEALRRWQHIFQHAGWSVAIANPEDNTFQAVNRAFASMHGYTVEELVGQPLARTFAPESVPELPELVRVAHEKGDHVYESVHVRKDGSRFPCLTHVTAFKDSTGKVIYRAATFQDLTTIRAAEQAVRESEARFRQLADAMPQIVWAARPDGHIDYYNERWYEYTGFGRGEYGQSSWEPILHPDDLQRCIDTYFGCIRDERPYQIEYRFKDRRTGGYRWFLGRARPIRDEAGRVVRWFGTCTDIDDTKQAEQTTRFLADASAALAELTDYRSTLQKVAALAVPFFADWCAVDILDADGSLQRLAVTHSDPAKVQLVHELSRRYPPRPSDPSGIMKVLRTGESDWAPMIPESLLEESARDGDHLGIIRELGLKSYICTPLRSRSRTIGVMTFVTAESGRTYDATALSAAEDLAHRAVIAIENADLLTTLKEADRRKDEFLAMLAHELRNPLAPIRNAVYILRGKGLPVPELQWATEVVDRQVHQMTRLVDDLLDVSRITRGKVELRKEPVELADVITSAVEASRPLIEKGGHELTVTVPPEPTRLQADPTRLAQVFLNLLNNAAKYTDRGGRIWLSADLEGEGERAEDPPASPSRVVVRIRDNGIGIPREMLPRVFDLFAQVDRSMDRSEGGLGIGLTLVQRLVEMHGGAVEARSDGPGKGSEFVVRLPVARDVAARGPAAAAEQAGAPAARRILIVDDNRDAADSLGMLLRLMGHEIHTAHDGLEAVVAAASFRPEVVLLDIGLPKLNGYEAARRIRQQEGGGDMLLVALTGWGQEEDRRRSREAGFDHHMTKPVEFNALQKLLAEQTSDRPDR